MQLLIRFALRVSALALKFVLAVVVARILGFAAVADYGIALAASVVSSKLLGLGFSAEINRRLSVVNPAPAIRSARSLLLLYCILYSVIVVVMATLYSVADTNDLHRIAPGILIGVMLVAFSEHAGLETNSYIFSLHRPRFGAVLLFIRTGAWAGIAIVGLLAGAIHSIEAIFALWCGTNVLAAMIAYQGLRIKEQESNPLRSEEVIASTGSIRNVWLSGMPFFVATSILSGLQYADRFLASGTVTADALGHYVFLWSIANSIQTIAYATIVVTVGPRLVRSLSVADGNFWLTLRRAAQSTAAITITVATAILLLRRQIFYMAHEAGGIDEDLTLITLLISFVLRAISDLYWSGAIALRLGKQLAISISVLAALSIPLEWILVSRLGTMGAALAHLTVSAEIIALLFAIILRARSAAVGNQKNRFIHAS